MTHFIQVLSLVIGSALPVFATQISGFVDDGGVFTSINDPLAPVVSGDSSTYAYGINNAGQIVGSYNFGHGFLYSGGTFTTIDVPPFGATAQGINNAGEIVGYYNPAAQNQGFLDIGGTFTTIDDPLESPPVVSDSTALGINDAGQIVGSYFLYPSNHGFLDVGGVFTTIDDPLATYTVAQGINDAGQIVGSYSDATGYHGFLDSGGNFTTIDDPMAAGETLAEGINAAGQIVGSYNDASGGFHGFLDSGGTFTSINGPFASDTWATGINDLGQITGFMQTPEPSTLVMAFAALLAMAGRLKRKRLTSTL